MAYRILLLSPPLFDYYHTPARKEPLGLYYIKSSLAGLNGIQVDIYDALHSGRKKAIRRPEAFSYLDDIYTEDTSRFSLFSRFFRFGDSYDKILSVISDGKYDLIAISSLFTAYHPDVESLAQRIKSELDVKVALGGWAVFSDPEWIFKNTSADYIIYGDSESGFKRLVEILVSGAEPVDERNIAAKGSDAISEAQASGQLMEAYPGREGSYYFKGRRIAKMILSRGCPQRCGFCSVHRHYPFSIRSLKSIRDEIEYLHGLGVEIIDFEDDNLFFGREFSTGLIEILNSYNLRGMNYTAMNGITASNLLPFTEEVIGAGFMELNVSAASMDRDVLHGINRPDFAGAVSTISRINSGRADMQAFLIAGLPGTETSLIKDIVSLAGMRLRIGYSPLYLLPRIDFFKNLGLPDDRRLMRGSALYKFASCFDRSDIASYWKLVRMINAVKTADDSVELEEDLHYFRRSVREKRWYCKKRDLSWAASFYFRCEFPSRIKIICMNGSEFDLNLS